MQIYKKNNRYAFKIGDFDSAIGFFLFPHVKSSYKCAWAAERDARIILKNMKSVLSVKTAMETDAQEDEPFSLSKVQSAESMIVTHYLGAYDSLVDKADGVKNSSDEEKAKVYEEIKIVVENLLKIKDQLEEDESKNTVADIISKFSRLTKSNFNDLLNDDIKKKAINVVERLLTANTKEMLSDNEVAEILEDSACKACEAISLNAPDAVYMINPKKKTVVLASNDRKIKYVSLVFDKNLLLARILPHSLMPKNNSGDFYQHILKPIFASVGHLKLPGKGVLLVNGISFLPDLNTGNATIDVDALDLKTKSACATTILFNNNKWKTVGRFEKTAAKVSKYTQEDYMAGGGALAECTDPSLGDLFRKRGKVVKVYTYKGDIYVYVQFGDKTVRLKDQKIALISDGVNNGNQNPL